MTPKIFDNPNEPSESVAQDTTKGLECLLESAEVGQFAGDIPCPPGLPLDKDPNGGEYAPQRTSADAHDAAIPSASEAACQRLIQRAFSREELPPLIEAILSSEDKQETIRGLTTTDAQTLIDVMEEAVHTPCLAPSTQTGWLKLLYRTCGGRELFPRALEVPVQYDHTGPPLRRGGYADVWKGKCRGRDVAVKVIRSYSNSVVQKIMKRFCKEAVAWKFLQHPNVLPFIGVVVSKNRLGMVSDWMKNGTINDFVKAHPEKDRFMLLEGVTTGLIYLHTNGMVHGDLKGENILIDETGCPRLADFGLVAIISDPAIALSSSSGAQGGTLRWMSPEQLDPRDFKLEDARPTVPSDCYALGMVVYEVISGNIPFHEYSNIVAYAKVMTNEHPTRGEEFPEHLWKMMESCWKFQPNDRPAIKDVLQCLHSGWSGTSLGGDEGIGAEQNVMEVEQGYRDASHDPSAIQSGAGDSVTLPALSHSQGALVD